MNNYQVTYTHPNGNQLTKNINVPWPVPFRVTKYSVLPFINRLSDQLISLNNIISVEIATNE
jgi:hypothetical protein